MKIRIDEELSEIVRGIHAESKTRDEWGEFASDDMFQSKNYVGGFEGPEGEFCFSYYADDGAEYWFQFDLEDVQRILDRAITELDARPAEV